MSPVFRSGAIAAQEFVSGSAVCATARPAHSVRDSMDMHAPAAGVTVTVVVAAVQEVQVGVAGGTKVLSRPLMMSETVGDTGHLPVPRVEGFRIPPAR